METRKLVLLLVLSGCLTACGSEDESPAAKDLFSAWTSTSTGVVFDFTNGTYGPQAFRYYVAVNNGCDCSLEILGNNDSGTARLYACTHFGPTDYCSAGTTIYNYTNQNATLTLCDGTCEEYR